MYLDNKIRRKNTWVLPRLHLYLCNSSSYLIKNYYGTNIFKKKVDFFFFFTTDKRRLHEIYFIYLFYNLIYHISNIWLPNLAFTKVTQIKDLSQMNVFYSKVNFESQTLVQKTKYVSNACNMKLLVFCCHKLNIMDETCPYITS